MFAARMTAQRNISNAKRTREAHDWNIVHAIHLGRRSSGKKISEQEKGSEATDPDAAAPESTAIVAAMPQEIAPPLLDAGQPTAETSHGHDSSNAELEDDDLIHHISLDGLEGARLQYVRLANLGIETLNHTWFNSLVMLCISWASLSVGLQTYPALSDSAVLSNLDLFVLSVFILEALIKILAEGLAPWRFFTGKEMRWNNFDFAIIVMSLPIWGSALGGNVAILRMLRLMRIMKLVKRIPQLYMIVMGLIGGLKSIGYIMLLLFLVFYLYAISGMYAWQDNDSFHFRNVPIAMITLFRMSTLENWSNIMNINYWGCDRFQGGYYSFNPEAVASYQFCNVTAVYGANVTDSELASARAVNQVMATFYFITFVLISAFVMLSLFIGAITMSMTQSMEQMKAAQEEIEVKRRAEKARRRALEAERRAQEAAERKRALAAAGLGTRHAKTANGAAVADESPEPRKKEKGLSAAERRERQKMREVLMQTWDDCDLTDILSHPQGDNNSLKGRYIKLAGLAARVVEHHQFANFVTGVICLAGLMVGLQTSPEVEEALGLVLTAIDTAILVVFTAEVVLKLLAEGLEPWSYFRTGWNVFDFIIVVGSFMPGTGSMLTMLRLLRLLRVLKLVRAFPQLQVIVSALLKGVGSIGYIGLILLLCFYVFGILGNMLFAANDPFHFANLHYAMISLFQLATMDGWTETLYINYYGCGLYGYSTYRALGYECEHNPSPLLAVLYFCSFIILGAMVLITLFIGVVTTSMEEATQEMEQEKEMLRRVEALRVKRGVEPATVASYMQVFHMLDLDGSGSVEEAELRVGLSAIGKNPSYEELKEMMDVVDEDGSGQIDLCEFVEFMIHVREKSNEQRKARDTARSTIVSERESKSEGSASEKPRTGKVKTPQEAAAETSPPRRDSSSSEDSDDEGHSRVLAIAQHDHDIGIGAVKDSHRSPAYSPRSARHTGRSNVLPYQVENQFQDANDTVERPASHSSSSRDHQSEPTSPRSGRASSSKGKIVPSG